MVNPALMLVLAKSLNSPSFPEGLIHSSVWPQACAFCPCNKVSNILLTESVQFLCLSGDQSVLCLEQRNSLVKLEFPIAINGAIASMISCSVIIFFFLWLFRRFAKEGGHLFHAVMIF